MAHFFSLAREIGTAVCDSGKYFDAYKSTASVSKNVGSYTIVYNQSVFH